MSFEGLTFQLPLPDRRLSPNARTCRAVKWQAVKAARAAARIEAVRVLEGCPPPRWGKAKLHPAVFLGPRNRQPDPDNLIASLKSYIDGLADAGIVRNDKDLWPARPTFTRVEKFPRIEITIIPE
jgi:hypothetical protein